MASIYKVFGLTLHSNLPIPGLVLAQNSCSNSDVEIHWNDSPGAETKHSAVTGELIYSSSYTDEDGNPGLRIWKTRDGTYLHLVYYDGIEFWLERKGTAVWGTWPETSTYEDAVSYLLGPVLGLLLRLRGLTCLHASAVAFKDRSIVFVGSEGAGKSTIAAAFSQTGGSVISDDVSALVESGGYFRVLPAYPHLCLWPDSVEMLYGSSETLPRFSPAWDKRRLDLGNHGTRFESRALPLGAVYVLGDRQLDLAPRIERIPRQAALLSLVADTFANQVLDRAMRADEFAVLGRLVQSVPVRKVHPHCEAARLEELCHIICKDFASLSLPAASLR